MLGLQNSQQHLQQRQPQQQYQPQSTQPQQNQQQQGPGGLLGAPAAAGITAAGAPKPRAKRGADDPSSHKRFAMQLQIRGFAALLAETREHPALFEPLDYTANGTIAGDTPESVAMQVAERQQILQRKARALLATYYNWNHRVFPKLAMRASVTQLGKMGREAMGQVMEFEKQERLRRQRTLGRLDAAAAGIQFPGENDENETQQQQTQQQTQQGTGSQQQGGRKINNNAITLFDQSYSNFEAGPRVPLNSAARNQQQQNHQPSGPSEDEIAAMYSGGGGGYHDDDEDEDLLNMLDQRNDMAAANNQQQQQQQQNQHAFFNHQEPQQLQTLDFGHGNNNNFDDDGDQDMELGLEP